MTRSRAARTRARAMTLAIWATIRATTE